MKKLTVFRTGEYETLSGKLLPESAYQVYAQAKDIRREFGAVSLIMSSHIPEAINTAKTIRLIMDNARINENARLSRYHAGHERAFKADFLGYVKHYYSHMEHIILVSHNMNIMALTGWHIRRGSSITLEAESWDSIFDLQTSRISVQEKRLEENGSSISALVEALSTHEKERVATLAYTSY